MFKANTNGIIEFTLFLEYTTFADVQIDLRGYRRLILDGYRFGEHHKNLNHDSVSWRCTAAIPQGGRCTARLKTKMIHGYEMIKSTRVHHQHFPLSYRNSHNQ